ncbi:MAG TPA: hypothetical protein VNH19_07035 [Candidatus Limnocylindrales bacterium]|nr:hypothetical protein [Candidatus Limnocylindrales bacterium]
MGKTVIVTKHHPSELGDIEKAEAYQICLLGGSTGDQIVQEQHGWWNERQQKAEALVTTFRPDEPLPLEKAVTIYVEQLSIRALEGFVHARFFSFTQNKFVYQDLRQTEGFQETLKRYLS